MSAPVIMIAGYEIHMGRTVALGDVAAATLIGDTPDGAVSDDGQVWGCYMHGLFANAGFRRAWLASLGWRVAGGAANALDPYDRLADVVGAALDLARLSPLFG